MCLPLKIVEKGGTGEVVEKKSRFIAQVFPVQSEEEALEFLAGVRKKHYDARHNCFAYVIGENNETERCSDDGEPSGTAGRPILDVITGQGIHDVLIVVTRYFGGTLLGTGGLVRAYSSAAKEGLVNSQILQKMKGFSVKIRTDYNQLGKIQYTAAERGLKETESQYGEDVELVYSVPEQDVSAFEQDIVNQTGGKAVVDRGEPIWIYLNI